MATISFLILKYAELKADLGHQPTSREARALSAQARRCKDLGSWNALVEVAGDVPRANNVHRRYPDEYLFKRLNDIYRLKGAYPRTSHGDWKLGDIPSAFVSFMPSPKTYQRRFGRLYRAIERAHDYLIAPHIGKL